MIQAKLSTLSELPDAAFSVADITHYIQSLLEQDPGLYRVWVTGEVSSANERNGHIFFTLQEPDGRASIQAVVWRSQRQRLAAMPASGEHILLLGQIRLYPQKGQYQISVFQVLPAGEGLQALQRQQLQQRLAAEGLFDAELKQAVPPYATRIAVITSAQAAAWGDIQRTLRQRQPGLQVLLSPATVQGVQAPASIVAAFGRVIADGRAEVIILARGGGAREDLTSFDDEQVVRAIAACPIPVITGIGHERDETLADLVADYCAHTPTAAAESAVLPLADLWTEHYGRSQIVIRALQWAIQQRSDTITDLRRRLEQLRVDQSLQQECQRLNWLQQRLQQTVRFHLHAAQQQCHHLGQTLKTLDPESVLRRGYAVVRADRDRILNRSTDVKIGEIVQIQLGEGEIVARVVGGREMGDFLAGRDRHVGRDRVV